MPVSYTPVQDTAVQNNFVQTQTLLEQLEKTFAAAVAPTTPKTGHLWYDIPNATLKVWNGSAWVSLVSGLSATSPLSYNGTTHVLSLTTVPISLGGTGQITANAGLNALLPSQATHGGQVLQTDGTNTSWVAPGSAPVTSVFGRTGAVVAATNDYTWAQVDKSTSSLSDITTRTHALLSGLAADDHTQYLLLAGRAGGQTVYGGTASGESLTLNSTSHATKGKIFFGASSAYDGASLRLGIGTASPTKTLQMVKTAASVAGQYLDNTAAVTIGQVLGAWVFGGAKDASHTLADATEILGVAGENWSSTATGTYLYFYTTPIGSTTLTARLIIGPDGIITAGAYGTGILKSNSIGTFSSAAVGLATADVTGTLPVGNGGSGATSLTGVLIGNGASAFTTKTNPSGAFVGDTDTQTLTNKTLTAPVIDEIKDANGNRITLFTAIASAVNYFTIKNNIAGSSPQLLAEGTSANLNINLIPKGTGRVMQNGTNIPSISSTDALTNKDLTSGTNTFPTFNQNTTGSAAKLTTARLIYGGSFDGSADVTSIIASTYGGTGNGFTKFSGPATSEKTFTLPNASTTILTTNDATGTGTTAVLSASPTIVTPTIASFVNAAHNHQNAAGGGTLDAAAIASGTIAPARLGSGSGGSSKFLREDSTFQTISGGGDMLASTYDSDANGIIDPGAGGTPSGALMPYAARVAPTGYLLCDGAAVSRTTYSRLFDIIAPSIGTFTVTIASPAVATLTAHGLITGDAVYLTTTGALPTGLSANTLYYIIKVTADTFNLATSRANADAGTKINTSGSQSGTHTLRFCPYGLGDASTTFNVPDLRANVPVGNKSSDTSFDNMGETGGEKTHTLTSAEMPSHRHTMANTKSGGVVEANPGSFYGEMKYTNDSASQTSAPAAAIMGLTGSDGAHQNMPPYQVFTYIIKT